MGGKWAGSWAEPATFDRIAAALRRRTRRRILADLLDADRLDLRDLTRGADHATRDELEARLIHADLPKLDDAGYVSWDREAEEITRGERWEEVAPVVRLLREHRERLPDDVF